jgi:hypothetical protein
MDKATASSICFGIGGLLIAAGLVWLIIDAIVALRRRPPKPAAAAAATGPFSGIAKLLKALTEFLRELRKHPKPFRLIYLGVLLLLVGAGLSVADKVTFGSSQK